MVKIFIDTRKIKKNPNGGNATHRINGPKIVRFEIKGNSIPLSLVHKCDITSWEGSPDPMNGINQCGYIIDPNDVSKFMSIPGISIEVDNNIQTIYSIYPEPYFFYEYFNTAVLCSNCDHAVMSDDLDDITHYDDNSDDYGDYTKCPNCGNFNTFNSEYQSINEIDLKKYE